jgi:hypothetical protein
MQDNTHDAFRYRKRRRVVSVDMCRKRQIPRRSPRWIWGMVMTEDMEERRR